MPFSSRSQMSVCYKKQIAARSRGKETGWNCDVWLAETPDPACLPYRKGGHPKTKCRNLKPGEKMISPIYKGARGGYYFYTAGVKVYIPKGNKELAYAKKTYGFAK